MADVNINLAPAAGGSHTFDYEVNGISGTPHPAGSSKIVVHGVEFGATLSDHLIFESDNTPFAVFFRYGTPEKGGINSTDEEKQIRSRERTAGGVTKQRASVRALKQGLYAPVIVARVGNNYVYDRGLSFEVHPSGA